RPLPSGPVGSSRLLAGEAPVLGAAARRCPRPGYLRLLQQRRTRRRTLRRIGPHQHPAGRGPARRGAEPATNGGELSCRPSDAEYSRMPSDALAAIGSLVAPTSI